MGQKRLWGSEMKKRTLRESSAILRGATPDFRISVSSSDQKWVPVPEIRVGPPPETDFTDVDRTNQGGQRTAPDASNYARCTGRHNPAVRTCLVFVRQWAVEV